MCQRAHILFGFWLTLLLIGIVSFSSPALCEEEVLKLGQTATFSGPSAALGIELWQGAEAYFTQVNHSGGVQGRKIEVRVLDDRYEADLAQENAITLMQDEQVFALFGTVGTPTVMRVLPALQLFSKKGYFLFSNFTGAQPQRQLPYQRFVFNVRPSYRDEIKEMIDQMVKLGYRKFALFIQGDAYGRSGVEGTLRALTPYQLHPLTEVSYPRGAGFQKNYRVESQLLIDSGAEVIISIGAYAACAGVIRDLRNLGFQGPIANVSFAGSEAMLHLLKKEEETTGKHYTHKLLTTQVVPPPSETTIPLVKEYLAALRKTAPSFPDQHLKRDAGVTIPSGPSFVSLEGYLNAKSFVSILRNVKGPLTREAFVRTAESLPPQDVGLGPKIKIRFSRNEHQALQHVYSTTIEKGEFRLIRDWSVFKP